MYIYFKISLESFDNIKIPWEVNIFLKIFEIILQIIIFFMLQIL